MDSEVNGVGWSKIGRGVSSWQLIAITSASQAEGYGFDLRGRQPKFSLEGYCFIPKTSH